MPTRTKVPAKAVRALTIAALLALLATASLPYAAHAKQKNRKNQPTIGRIEVSTNPGGYPIYINGTPAGETTDYVRSIDLEPGAHTVEIVFPNNTRWQQTFQVVTGRKYCIALNYRPSTISVQPLPTSPCPYPVNVTAPAQVGDGDIVTFTADVGYTGQSALNYTWTVSPPAARILTGAGTPTITVDSAGLGNRRLTAILVVDDGSGDRNCRQTAQAATAVTGIRPPEGPKRFDEFPSVAFDDDKARLDNLAIELQNNPGASGYIISYAGRRSRAGEAERMNRRAAQYLTSTRGISAGRVVTINGGYRESNSYEIWIVPQGATPPAPTPTINPADVQPPGRRRRY
ncbi:MAG TPA: PEGA domain-containing protein [Pyrinomonadaceae bacterium]|nr:PEGA domain-containing protein [Pyrinomonadaceae bacterium]